MGNKRTTEELISSIRSTYGDYFQTSKTKWNGSKKTFTVTCPIHGDFEARYDHFITQKCGCKSCNSESRRQATWNRYMEAAKKIHGDKYEYHKEDYIDSISKVRITCKVHGDFLMTMASHVDSHQGCPKCYLESKKGNYKKSIKEIVDEARKIHGDKYEYLSYNGMKGKMDIICPIHGKFSQVAYDHLKGLGCEKCKFKKMTSTTNEFNSKVEEKFPNKFDLSKVDYVNNHTPITVGCKTHGYFTILPSHLLMGFGCKKCNESRLENEVMGALENNSIDYEFQCNCRIFKFLGKQSLDFYLPKYNIAIECQGEQHFIETFFSRGRKDMLVKQIERDNRKLNLCKKHGIRILYFTHFKEPPYECFTNVNDLIETIKGM